MKESYRHQGESTIHLASPANHRDQIDVPCKVVEIRGRHIRLKSKDLIPAGVALSVEHDDALYLGEVVHCILQGSDYSVDIEVEQVLTGLQSLVSLRARLLDEQATSERGPQKEKANTEKVRASTRRREE